MSLYEWDRWSLHVEWQGWCGFGSSSVLMLSPWRRAEMFAEGSWAEQGAKGGPGAMQGLALQHAPLCMSMAPI